MNLVQGQFMEQLQKADKKFIDLQAHERNTGTGLIYSKKGKPISDKVQPQFKIYKLSFFHTAENYVNGVMYSIEQKNSMRPP